MATGNRRRSRSPPANRQRGCSPPPTASSLFFPPELIPEVAKRLTNLQDFFALRATCRAYRALLPLTPSNLASQAPLLLLIPRDRTQSHALFHPRLRRIHRFRLPHTSIPDPDSDAYNVGTRSHTFGCRLVVSSDYYGCPSIFHLLTGEQTCCLPSPRADISRLLLFGDLAVAWSSDDNQYRRDDIQYCRFGAPGWRVATIGNFPNEFGDFIFVKGTLYALVNTDPGYRVAVVNLPDDDDDNLILELEFLGPQFDIEEDDKSVFCLAECCGELLLVIRGKDMRFQVLKWQAGEGKWSTITSLGGRTLFFADYCFSGCLGPDHPGIQGDCIYMTRSMMCAVFSLVGQPTDMFFVSDPRRAVSDYWSTPLWVYPSMC